MSIKCTPHASCLQGMRLLPSAIHATHINTMGGLTITSGARFQYFVLRFGFGFQLAASATQRTMNGFLCFNALQR